jgi:hypothetical protein
MFLNILSDEGRPLILLLSALLKMWRQVADLATFSEERRKRTLTGNACTKHSPDLHIHQTEWKLIHLINIVQYRNYMYQNLPKKRGEGFILKWKKKISWNSNLDMI